ncbi:hypothetical protein [Alteromonas sp. ASW11-130]|uniref:hypothetical protein n=1 Tax=Alteromonas sp. ASW11-130 TaxID=3015775 RepID=UPI0022426870|nr:hypothetical protein [Alteromonas sp. ASW11-130]MCW8091226.1 hypothetical protein [Alteromonas sp. ASW11-130]
MKDLKKVKYQPEALLLGNYIRDACTTNWPQRYFRWLIELLLLHPAQHFVLQLQLISV